MQIKTVVDAFSIDQIVPYFQPVFDLTSYKAVRYECLSRLLTSDDKIYLPSEFLHIVSQRQSSAILTQRMVQMSNAYCSPKGMRWSINMFPTDIRDTALVKWMQDLFLQLNSSLVGLELSYDSVKSQPHLLSNLLEKLPNVHVTIDGVDCVDENLKEIIIAKVHAIKIKGTLITDITKNGENKALFEKTVAMCKLNNCDLIAEHIEDENILSAVRSIGIQYGQGYFLSRPEARTSSL